MKENKYIERGGKMQQNTHSFKINDANLEKKIIEAYAEYSIPQNSPYVKFCYLFTGVRITIYHSQKIVFQGKHAYQEAKRWFKLNIADHPVAKKELKSMDIFPQIGCDETGVGDYFAPIVVATCLVTLDTYNQLKNYAIQDSKKINKKTIEKLYPILKEKLPHSIQILTNTQYNICIDRGYNGHAIKAFVHNKNLINFSKSYNIAQNPQIPIIMDAFSTKKNYLQYLQNEAKIIEPTIFLTQAESHYFSVACASILARGFFLQYMTKINLQYQTEFPLGAGKNVDIFGKKFLQTYGSDEMKKLVKWHFATTHKIIK